MSVRKISLFSLSAGMLFGLFGCDDGAAGTYQPGNGGGGQNTNPLGSGGNGGFNGSGGSGGGGAAAPTGMPCDVQEIVQTKCGLCHGAMPNYGAPLSLATQSHFQVAGGDGNVVHQNAKARINGQGNIMPPPQQPTLTPEELTTLNAWLDGGAQYSSESCGQQLDGTGGSGGDGDGVVEPPADADECHDLLTYGQNDATAPFSVPTGEHYWNFTFKKPWTGDVQALTIRHKIDNTPVVHHTLLYQAEGTLPIGVTNSLGTHGSDALIAGWVPGASDTVLPADVGLELSQGDFTIEFHYSNTTGQPQPDRSGLEICVTHTKRPNAAAIHWLGKEQVGFPAAEWQGVCTPDYSQGPITIISSWPHMHLTGRHFSTYINRTGGQREMLTDAPFDFDFQATYDTPAVLMPGDTLTTTCTFDRPMAFGTSTGEEMCYNFVVAYPAGSLTGGGGLTSSVNHCL